MAQKSQELKDLTHTFEVEAGRLNEIIQKKAEQVDRLASENSKEKSKVLQLTQQYEA